MLNKVHNDFKADKIAWAKHWNEVGLSSLEKKLEACSGIYSVGDELTLADAFIFPQAASAFARFGINKDDYPVLKRVFDNLAQLPEFIAALPQNQPDFEA